MALPVAEEYDFRMCPEIHVPTALKSKMVDDYINFIEKTGTRNFGINIDFSVFNKKPMAIPGMKFTPSTPEEMIPYLKYTYCCHAKFSHMKDDLTEENIPYDEIIKILVDQKWEGYLLSEFEDYEGGTGSIPDHASDQVRRQHVMMKRLLGEV
ncbi:MAG TPA: hypothetical protein VK179_16275 [Bacteroidales bacterium]|nr:hypothetical protein [Bacteroidales bacterium]